jgi:hypothetical protein
MDEFVEIFTLGGVPILRVSQQVRRLKAKVRRAYWMKPESLFYQENAGRRPSRLTPGGEA